MKKSAFLKSVSQGKFAVLVPKSESNKVIFGVIGALLTPVVVVGLSVLLALQITGLPEDAAFRVYDTVVSKADLKHRQDVLKALYGIQAPPADPAAQDAFRRQSAQAVALSMVIDRAARDEGIVPPDKDVQSIMQQTVSARFPGGVSQFAELLGQVGASADDVTDEIRRQEATRLLFDKVVKQQGPAGLVSEQEARAYYDQNPAEFLQPEARHLRNIVVPGEDDANQVAAQARAGTDFASLAKQFSLDESTRDTGGDLGFKARDQLEDAFGQAAFSAGTGSVFGPVKTEKGWNVGQLLEVRPAVQLAFDPIKDDIRRVLQDRRALDYWRNWVGQRVAGAQITYADAYRPTPDSLASVADGGRPSPGGAR